MSNLNPTPLYPACRSAVAAPLLASVLTLAAWMPAGPAAAAIVNYSIADPTAWTGGALTIGSLSDSISILPSLITGTVNGVTSSFVPTFVGNSKNELWYDSGTGNYLDLYSTDFGFVTADPMTTWQDIITTYGGTYANNDEGFSFIGASPSVARSYGAGGGNGTSVTFTFSAEVPVPAPLALLLAAVPAVWLTRRRRRSVRAG